MLTAYLITDLGSVLKAQQMFEMVTLREMARTRGAGSCRAGAVWTVRRRPLRAGGGLLCAPRRFGLRPVPCTIGRGGLRALKREGDGGTPIGRWPLRELLYRPDRLNRPVTGLPVRALGPNHAWCDVPFDRNYNRLVRLPYPVLHERLWRSDSLYDLIVVVGYNDGPRSHGKGSAIFLHLMRPDGSPTAGCLGFAPAQLRRLVSALDRRSWLRIG